MQSNSNIQRRKILHSSIVLPNRAIQLLKSGIHLTKETPHLKMAWSITKLENGMIDHQTWKWHDRPPNCHVLSVSAIIKNQHLNNYWYVCVSNHIRCNVEILNTIPEESFHLYFYQLTKFGWYQLKYFKQNKNVNISTKCSFF